VILVVVLARGSWSAACTVAFRPLHVVLHAELATLHVVFRQSYRPTETADGIMGGDWAFKRGMGVLTMEDEELLVGELRTHEDS